jgi:pyruvate ferredoxin oxidoreductase beta subunit
MLLATDYNLVLTNATGCLEVATTIYPYTSWRIPWFHSAFENSAATAAGVETMYRVLVKQGKTDKDIRFIALGGDGGTYDIGLQSLSGALERGHRFLYLCYDNGAYMNTGIQRSSSTPLGAHTTTSPAGAVIQGKQQYPKNLTKIVVAHGVPYVAQVSPHNARDLTDKVKRALDADGPSFINAHAPCPRGWRSAMEDSIELCRVAADTCVWPLYEVTDGKYKINYKPKQKKPVEEWLRPQGRFAHLFRPDNAHIIERFQAFVDQQWEELLWLAGRESESEAPSKEK